MVLNYECGGWVEPRHAPKVFVVESEVSMSADVIGDSGHKVVGHGVCPECRAAQNAQFDAMKKAKEAC